MIYDNCMDGVMLYHEGEVGATVNFSCECEFAQKKTNKIYRPTRCMHFAAFCRLNAFFTRGAFSAPHPRLPTGEEGAVFFLSKPQAAFSVFVLNFWHFRGPNANLGLRV